MLAAGGDGWAVDSKISVACVAGYSCPCMMPSVHRLRLRHPALALCSESLRSITANSYSFYFRADIYCVDKLY